MSHSIILILLILTLLPGSIFSQPFQDAYEILYRDDLPIRRSTEFGMTNGPDSEVFQSPLFCLQCEGEYCEHNYLETVTIEALPNATRVDNQTAHNIRLPNSTPGNDSSNHEEYIAEASRYQVTNRQFQNRWVGRERARRAICPDQQYVNQVSHDRETKSYRVGCGRLAENLKANPADTQEKLVRPRSLSRLKTLRQTSLDLQYREAVCDNGYYIWGMACAGTACDYFNIICVRVLILRDGEDHVEPMETTATRICNRRVCCPLSCGTCGGADCSRRDGGARNCCEADIRLFDSVCSGPNDSPCIRSPEFIFSTGIDNSYLQYCNGRVCCATSCEQCGGAACSSFTGGAENCCNSRILSSGKFCNGHEDFPCILRKF